MHRIQIRKEADGEEQCTEINNNSNLAYHGEYVGCRWIGTAADSSRPLTMAKVE